MTGRLIGAGVVVAIGLTAGCGLRGPTPLVPVSAESLLDALRARRAAVTSLRARAHVRTGVARVWTREVIVVQRPTDVRIDVLTPFGLALALGTDGTILWAFRPSDQTRYEGPATPANLARFLAAPVAVGDLVDVLLGLPPDRRAVGPALLEVTHDHLYRLSQPIEGGAQSLWFTGDTHLLERVEEERGGTAVLRIAFGDHRDGLPHRIEIEAPGLGAAASLAYDAATVNVELASSLFTPPAAAQVLSLDVAAEAH